MGQLCVFIAYVRLPAAVVRLWPLSPEPPSLATHYLEQVNGGKREQVARRLLLLLLWIRPIYQSLILIDYFLLIVVLKQLLFILSFPPFAPFTLIHLYFIPMFGHNQPRLPFYPLPRENDSDGVIWCDQSFYDLSLEG